MNTNVSGHPEAPAIPESAADAWAAVYIDVAEKLDAEEQAGDAARETTEADRPPDGALPAGEAAGPARHAR